MRIEIGMMDLGIEGARYLSDLIGGTDREIDGMGRLSLTIEPFGILWLRIVP
jgi:hypothetical protein